MKFSHLAAGLALALGGLAAQATTAGVVFQSIPDLAAAPDVNAYCSSCAGSFQVYDAFTLGSASTLGSAAFDVQTSYFFPTDVEVSIYTGTPDAPGTTLFDHTYTPADFLSTSATSYDTTIVDVSIPGLALDAGSYVISFYNPDNLGIPAYSGGSGQLYQTGFGYVGGSAGFALSDGGAVPEPAAWTLMLVGVGGLGGALRSRSARKTAAA